MIISRARRVLCHTSAIAAYVRVAFFFFLAAAAVVVVVL